MKAKDFADSLKVFVNWDKSEFTRETLEFPYDFYRGIEYALREAGRHSRIYSKIIWIPIVDEKRYYTIDLTKLTQDKIDLVKILDVSLFNVEGECSKKLESAYVEQIQYSHYLDINAIAELIYGSKHNLLLKTTYNGVTSGVYCDLSAIVGADEITVSENLEEGYIISNLSCSDREENYYATIESGGTTITTDKNITSDPYSWAVGDKLFASDTIPSFIKLLIQSIPQSNSITSGELEVNCPNQIEKNIKDLAVSYLYSILISRNINEAKVYEALLSTKVLMPYSEAIVEIRKKTQMLKSLIVKSYDPY